MLRVIAVLFTVLFVGLTAAQDPPLAAFRNFGGSQCIDTGLAFDGSDDYLAIAPDFDVADSHTISMRIKYIDMRANYERLYDFSGSNCGQHSYFVDAYTSRRMTHQTYGCGTLGVDDFWIYGDGQFHTYSFTSSSSGEFKVYRDGTLMGTGRGACSAARQNELRNTHYIGGSTCIPNGINTFHGEMEWFAIHDAVLSSDQLQQVSSTAVRSQASHYFDFVNDCDSNANGVPSVPIPPTTTTTTQTSTTHTADQQRDVRLNRLEEQLRADDGEITLDEIRTIVTSLRGVDTRLVEMAASASVARETVATLRAELDEAKVSLLQTRADMDAGIAQLAGWVANATDLATLRTQVSTMAAAAAAAANPALVGNVRAQGPPRISADGNTISVTADACGGTVDICAAMQRVDQLTDAVSGN